MLMTILTVIVFGAIFYGSSSTDIFAFSLMEGVWCISVFSLRILQLLLLWKVTATISVTILSSIRNWRSIMLISLSTFLFYRAILDGFSSTNTVTLTTVMSCEIPAFSTFLEQANGFCRAIVRFIFQETIFGYIVNDILEITKV